MFGSHQSHSSLNEEALPILLLLGDSLTQQAFSLSSGWACFLADKTARRMDVIARGFTGYSSRMIRYFIPKLLEPFACHKICGVTILLGSNDSLDNPEYHVPVKEYEENLKWIIRSILERHPDMSVDNIVLVSPPPVDEVDWKEYCVNHYSKIYMYTNAEVKLYAEAAARVASDLEVSFVDFHHLALKAGVARNVDCLEQPARLANFFTDGVHLGPGGAHMLASELWKVISPLVADFPELLPSWGNALNPTTC